MPSRIVGLLLLTSLVGGVIHAQAGNDDAAKLRGTWLVVSVERDGESEKPPKGPSVFFRFEDGKMIMKTAEETLETSTFKLDPSKKPKEIDLFTGEKGKDHVKGIYALDGDTLKICIASLPPQSSKDDKPKVSGPRPTEFAAKKGQMRFHFVLERQKS